MIKIRDANNLDEVNRVADLIARSFDGLPINHHLVPDPEWRLPIMRDYFRLHAAHAYRPHVGRVIVTEDLAAAAVWFRRTVPFTPPANYEDQLADLTGMYLPGFQDLDALLVAYHPQARHWHLAFLAVEPERQGQGLGTALLTHTLDWLDRGQVPAYLEATNTANRRLYTQLGFRDLDRPIRLGPDRTLHPMWRPVPADHPAAVPAGP